MTKDKKEVAVDFFMALVEVNWSDRLTPQEMQLMRANAELLYQNGKTDGMWEMIENRKEVTK